MGEDRESRRGKGVITASLSVKYFMVCCAEKSVGKKCTLPKIHRFLKNFD